jgi:hypothetical protein
LDDGGTQPGMMSYNACINHNDSTAFMSTKTCAYLARKTMV